jgi:hypothetical protein
MNANLKKTLAVTTVSMMLVVCSLLVAVQAQSAQGELGKDLASDIRGIVQNHKADIQTFILETKVDAAETEQDKLAIVDEYLAQLREKIDEVKSAKEDWIAQLESEEIGGQEFGMEMKDLGLQIAEVAKTMGALGEELGALGQSTATAIRERVADLLAELQGFVAEMGAIGLSIAQDMADRELPVPELPVIPNIPELPLLPNILGIPNLP